MSKTIEKVNSNIKPSEFFKKLDLSKLDANTAQYIREEILSFGNTDLLDGTPEFEEVRKMIEDNYPQALGIIPVPEKDIEEKTPVKKEITGKVNKKEQQRIEKEEKEAAKEKHKQEVEEIEGLIELMQDTVKENPKDTDSKDYLELLEDTLKELKKKKFEEGGEVGDDDDDSLKLEYIGDLIVNGYITGHDPYWHLKIDFDGEIDEADRRHIADLVVKGFTSGEIVSGEESKRGWWSIEIGDEMKHGGEITDNDPSLKKLLEKIEDSAMHSSDGNRILWHILSTENPNYDGVKQSFQSFDFEIKKSSNLLNKFKDALSTKWNFKLEVDHIPVFEQEVHSKLGAEVLARKIKTEVAKKILLGEKYDFVKFSNGGVVGEDIKIKDWYTKEYSSDDLGKELNDNSTFKDLLTAILNGNDVYSVLGVSDSVVRERVFAKLSKINNKEGQWAYNNWLMYSKEYAKGGEINSKYLDTISDDKKSKILKNIANHYGISVADAEQEVKDADAEMLYEYIANDQSLRMDVYNDFKINKYVKGGGVKNDTLSPSESSKPVFFKPHEFNPLNTPVKYEVIDENGNVVLKTTSFNKAVDKRTSNYIFSKKEQTSRLKIVATDKNGFSKEIAEGVNSKGEIFSNGGGLDNKDLLPPVMKYSEYLQLASSKFGITIDEARNKYGQYTIGQWENLLSGVQESTPEFEGKYVYKFHEERGELSAYVENMATGEEVWSFKYPDYSLPEEEREFQSTPVNDGFIRHWEDVSGLETYLKDLGVLPDGSQLLSEVEANKIGHYKEGGGVKKWYKNGGSVLSDGLNCQINAIRNVVYFAYNYPNNFIDEVWSDNDHLKEHIKQKFNSEAKKRKDTGEAFIYLVTDIDSGNQSKLFKWIDKNYKSFSSPLGGSFGSDDIECKINAMRNAVYFMFNYPNKFVEEAFSSNPMKDHIEKKANSYYNDYNGGAGWVLKFIVELDAENQLELLTYIANNYQAFSSKLMKKGGDVAEATDVFVIGDVLQNKTHPHIYVTLIVERNSGGSGQLFTAYESDKNGKAVTEGNWVRAIWDWDFKEWNKVGHVNLKQVEKKSDDSSYSYYKSGNKQIDNYLSLFDDRYQFFVKNAPKPLKNLRDKLESDNHHYATATLVSDFFNNPKKNKVTQYKFKKGGKIEKEFIEKVKSIHNQIKEVTLKDGTKIDGKDLMAEGGSLKNKERVEIVLKHYLIAALWSSTDSDNEDQPFDNEYDIEDFDKKTVEKVRQLIINFLMNNEADLKKSGLDDEQIGHDLWLTQVGHGAGFWDRGLDKELGDKLSSEAKKLGQSANLYAEKGKVYIDGLNNPDEMAKGGGIGDEAKEHGFELKEWRGLGYNGRLVVKSLFKYWSSKEENELDFWKDRGEYNISEMVEMASDKEEFESLREETIKDYANKYAELKSSYKKGGKIYELNDEEKTIIDNRIDYYFENNKYTKDSDVLTEFVMESGEIDSKKREQVKGYIKKFSVKMSNGGVVSELNKEEFAKKIKDLLKQENKWHFVGDVVNGKKVRMKFFVGKKEVDVQIFTIDDKGTRMPRNYSSKRDTFNMIMENFSDENFSDGGGVKDGKYGYVAFYKGKQMDVWADTSYQAQQKAAAAFKAKKSYDVNVVLAEKDGKQVTHVADFKKGGKVQKYGVYVFGALQDDFNDELVAEEYARLTRSIHPKWKVEVKPI